MRERNISNQDVRGVLRSRGPSHPSPKKRTARGRTLGGARRLEVVYTEEHREEFRIVTVKLLDR